MFTAASTGLKIVNIALAGHDGQLLARRRISDDAAGLAQLLELLAAHGDSAGDPIPVAIETPRGLLVAALRATGRQVYPVNPMAVARCGTGTRSRAGNPTTATRSSWPTSCAPTSPCTGRCLPTASWPRPSRYWPAPSKRRLGPHHRAQQAPLPPARILPRFLAAYDGARGGIHPRRGPRRPGRAATPADAARLTLTQLRDTFRAEQMRQLPLVETRAARPSPCCASSMLPAPAPMTSSTLSPSLLTCTRTPGSSPASQGSAH